MVAIKTSEVVPLEEVSRCELLVLAAGTSLRSHLESCGMRL
jgi:hypothetical protein